MDNYAKNFGWQFDLNIEEEEMSYGKSPAIKAREYLQNLKIDPSELKGKRLLVAGCGAAKEVKFLTNYGWFITALDYYPAKAISECKSLQNVEVIKADIKDFITDKRYDYISSIGVLHHTPVPEQFFYSLAKNLKEDGKIYLWIYNRQRLGLIRTLFKPYKWDSSNLLKFSKMLSFLSYPVYSIIKKRKKPISSLTLHIFDALCCKYQFVTKEKEVRRWFNNIGLNCEVNGEGYLGFK